MDAFVISDSYNAHQFLFASDLMTCFHIDTFHLLSEYHVIDEFKGTRYDVIIHDKMKQCIDNSDIIFNLSDNNSKISPFSKTVCLPYRDYLTRNVTDSRISISPDELYRRTRDSKGIPRLAVVSIGKFTDSVSIEIATNHILTKLGANLKQFFSCEADNLINSCIEQGILNTYIQKDNCCEVPDVDVVSLHISDYNETKLVQYITVADPDVLIICFNKTFNKEYLKPIIRFFPINTVFIESSFIPYRVSEQTDYPVFCRNNTAGKYLCIDSYNFMDDFRTSIINGLSLPDGIHTL